MTITRSLAHRKFEGVETDYLIECLERLNPAELLYCIAIHRNLVGGVPMTCMPDLTTVSRSHSLGWTEWQGEVNYLS